MVLSTYLFMKLMICFMVLCTFVQISSTQINSEDDEDQTQVYDRFFNSLIAESGPSVNNNPNRLNIPERQYDYHHQQQLFHQNKQYNPDKLQLAKRIIMLPRVGRR